MLAVVLMGILLPLAAYPVLHFAGRLARADAASIAAHYASVSVGTYAVAAAYLAYRHVAFEEYIAVFLVLLETGLIAAGQAGSLRQHGLFLIVFGIAMPLVSGALGAGLGWMLGLSVGGTALLATLAASASYIAVPAAMRLSVPQANPTLSLAASLGVTFPFNILAGIPIYHRLAEHIHRLGG